MDPGDAGDVRACSIEVAALFGSRVLWKEGGVVERSCRVV